MSQDLQPGELKHSSSIDSKNGEEFLKLMIKTYCFKPKIMNSTDLSGYYHQSMTHFNKAIQFRKDRKDFGAYIELMKYADIVTNLSNHKSYNIKRYKPQKELHHKRLSHVLDELEKLKPELIRKYEKQYSTQMYTFHCGICFAELPVEDIYIVKQCNHKYCKPCFKEYLKSDLCSNQAAMCPHENCGTKIHVDYDIQQLLKSPQSCNKPTKGCSQTPNGYDTINYNNIGNSLEQKIKSCPECHANTARLKGCNHIKCKCGTHWCWLCVEQIHKNKLMDHFGKLHPLFHTKM